MQKMETAMLRTRMIDARGPVRENNEDFMKIWLSRRSDIQ